MSSPLLQHLAVIMDGNGRWAHRRGKPRSAGHKAGVKAARSMIEACREYRIEYLTLFAFSSENWKRPQKEVGMLMELFLTTLDQELPSLLENNVCLHFIGERAAFSSMLQNKMRETEARTAARDGLKLNIAVNYGGRLDITSAAKQLLQAVQNNQVSLDAITPELFAQYVSLADIPEPDLLVRTGGEYRISNFLLWQMAYTELYFTDILWPDFDAVALAQALDWYQGRQRRFGETPEQAQAKRKRYQHA